MESIESGPGYLTLAERVRLILQETGWSQVELARVAGVSKASVNAWVKGKALTVDYENARRIQSRTRFSADWISKGRGDPWISEQPQPYGTHTIRFVQATRQPMSALPESIWMESRFFDQAAGLHAAVATTDARAFITRVDDAALAPRYQVGEYALIEPSVAPDIEDDVLVRLRDGRVLLRRLLSRRGGVRLGSWRAGDAPLLLEESDIEWIYYVAHPLPARRIESRA